MPPLFLPALPVKGPLLLSRSLVGGALCDQAGFEPPLLRLTLQFAVKGAPLDVRMRGDAQGPSQSIRLVLLSLGLNV